LEKSGPAAKEKVARGLPPEKTTSLYRKERTVGEETKEGPSGMKKKKLISNLGMDGRGGEQGIANYGKRRGGAGGIESE